MVVDTSIRITKEVRRRLDKLKIIPRDTYNDVILRLIDKKRRKDNE